MIIQPTNKTVNLKDIDVGDLFFIKGSGLAVCTDRSQRDDLVSYKILAGHSVGANGRFGHLATGEFSEYKVICMPQKGDKITIVYHNNNVRVEAFVSRASAFHAYCEVLESERIHLEIREDGIYDADWNAKVDVKYGHALPVFIPVPIEA